MCVCVFVCVCVCVCIHTHTYTFKRLVKAWTVRGSNPGGSEIFRRQDRPWGPSSLLYNGYRVLPGVKSGRGVTLTPHPLLVPWSRKCRAIPLLLLWVIRPVQNLSACTRVTFIYHLKLPRRLNSINMLGLAEPSGGWMGTQPSFRGPFLY